MSTPNKRLRSKRRNADRFNARPSQVRYKEASLQRTLKKLLMAPLVALFMLFHRDKPTPKLRSYRLGKKRNKPCPCGRVKPITGEPVKYKKCCWQLDSQVVV